MKKNILALLLLALFTVSNQAQAQVDALMAFQGNSYGANPYGSLISDGTYLYGMTAGGGPNGAGLVFKIKPDGSNFDTLQTFNGVNGANPHGSLFSDGTYLYGMTTGDNSHNKGTVFKVKPDGSGFAVLLTFNGANGANPNGSLISDGTYLYGMTVGGGTNSVGIVFKIKPDGTGYTNILNFTVSNGASPNASLFSDGTYLYGTTMSGGAYDNGVIFKVMPDGSGYSTLFGFNIGSAAGPSSTLVSDGTYLYGLCNWSGAHGVGSVYKIKPDGTGFTNMYDFNSTSGNTPQGSPILIGNYLYGTTNSGGSNNKGELFKIKTDGTNYTALADFNTALGANPSGDLYYDGTYFYGTAVNGGIGNGVIFRLNPPGTALNFDGSDDFVDIGTGLNAILQNSNKFMVEAWVKPSIGNNLGVIVGNYNTSTPDMQFLLRLDATNYTFWVHADSSFKTITSIATATINTWQHVAGVWDGSTLKIFINGVLDNTVTGAIGSGMAAFGNPVWIGGDNIAESFVGSIDEVRIWNRTMCQAEIQHSIYGELIPNGNLLAYYKFNQGYANSDNTAVTTLADSSGNAFNGTLNNFALTGATSNFVFPGAVTSGNLVAAYNVSFGTVATHTNITCNGLANGIANIAATSDDPIITYNWSTGDTTATQTGLAPATYTCTTTSCGISATQTITITEPAQLVASSTSGTIACNSGVTTVTVSATGGTGALTGTGTFTVTANSYTYTVTDANSCIATTTITVAQPNPIDTSITISPAYFPVLTANVTGATYQWVTCGSSTNTPIPGATQQSYTTTSNALSPYAVIITQGTCSAISDCRYDAIIEGITQYNTNNNLQVYPNPFTNELTITSTAKTKAILFDILGNQIHSFNLQNTTQTISFGDLAPGMYYLQVDEQKIKIIKQ